MRFRIIVILCMLLAGIAWAQEEESCGNDPLYKLMDFWVGDWEVYNQNNVLVGHNKIDKILQECAIMENWQDMGGGLGKSLFYVDNNTKNWKQVWVTQNAKLPWGQKEKKLIHFKKAKLLVFQGEYMYKGSRVLDRTLLEKVSAKEVKQSIQLSYDGGQTWKTTFIGIYKKADQ
ncbi:hypothetical protein GWK08_14875 [Leptobacterium flavescens]|uniref:DUF1579 domain-containing protein n=1 Tax=Leptobacterium flavescens TaxID=472055 RepID=A0A6P0URY3_9FLAO|nr:hypothetical protein [Leptobacterium flavescens]NER14738.1 hypothetical protein [Leptobacterium flavescens]